MQADAPRSWKDKKTSEVSETSEVCIHTAVDFSFTRGHSPPIHQTTRLSFNAL
jgi:hypothetical protein